MSGPKVFVSSTCYDLSMARDQLRNFLLGLGYEPVLSEYSDVLFDPRVHTHTSCIRQVAEADIIVLIIGSRFGGKAIPEALSSVDIDRLVESSFDIEALEKAENLSVTQLEVLKAIECEIPVFTFVADNVWHDHFVYEKNKEMAGQIKFPSLERPETARFIFEFINFLRQRVKGNAVVSFRRVDDIENHLRTQWASYFQRLLREQRDTLFDHKRVYGLSEKLEDLKTAVLSSIDNAQSRQIARGVIRYRRLVDFLLGLQISNPSWLVQREGTMDELLKELDIQKVFEISDSKRSFGRTALIKSDGSFYEVRFPPRIINELALDWQSFISLGPESRQVIVDALAEERRVGISMVRYRQEKFDEYYSKEESEEVGLPDEIES